MKIRYRYLRKTYTLKRFYNTFLTYFSYVISLFLKKPITWGFPPFVMIEITNHCNLKCPLCPSGNGTMKREKGFMSLETYIKVINEIKDKSFGVILWNQGEPFLNEKLIDMISYASKNRLHTLVSTNANIDIDPDKLIDSGLDNLIISLDGATQQTYNKYRVNGDLSKVLNNVSNISNAKLERKKKSPEINLQFLIMRHNESEVEDIKIKSKELGADSLIFKTLQIYSKSDIIQYLPTNPKYRRYKITEDDFELKFGIKNRCYRIWAQPVVNWNGELSVCCFDKDIKFPLGNIHENSISKIWKGNKIQRIRSRILKKRESISMCRNCGEGVKLILKTKKLK